MLELQEIALEQLVQQEIIKYDLLQHDLQIIDQEVRLTQDHLQAEVLLQDHLAAEAADHLEVLTLAEADQKEVEEDKLYINILSLKKY
jgi:hypothetical protein